MSTAIGAATAPLSQQITRREQMPPELAAKFQQWLAAPSRNHPLYATEGKAYGSTPHEYKQPDHGKAGGFSKVRSDVGRSR